MLIILIPVIVVNTFIKTDEIKFEYKENMLVRVKRTNGNIEKIPLEEYIVGVLAGEMPITFNSEALKAQAVAARTYVLKHMSYNIKKDYDVVDTVMDQVYLDNNYLKEAWGNKYINNINILRKIALETYGEYMTYEDNIIEAFYFSTSPGQTENSEDIFTNKVPYLRSVDSSWDNISPVYEETKYFTLLDFFQKLNIKYSNELKIEYLKKTNTGRSKIIRINNIQKDAKDITSALGLRSTYFNIEQINNIVKIETKGYGHGVGMSQYGAEAMSRLGYTYQDILKHYYQGIEIKKVYKS